ncbi:chemotaxis protein CheC [Gemmatimonas sp.]|uniref:chemotaxis protein CheC n=1 Tax=Gemmatimonas sp. TaxID=1962908 RepID=UPI0037C0BCBE
MTEGDVTMSAIRSLKTIQLDALRETANIGAGHAATALSQLTGSTIMIKVPSITIASMEELPSQFAPEEEPVAAVLMHMLGDLSGRTMLVFPKPTVMRLAELMLRRPVGSSTAFSELETSAIKEAGNILSGAYMNALSDFLGMLLLPSPPSLVIDMSTAVLTSAIGEFSPDPDAILCVESEFQLMEMQQTLRGFFLLLPDPASLQVMLRALRLA